MDIQSLSRWQLLFPELNEYAQKLEQNGYTDNSLLLLSPDNPEDWNEFTQVMQISPGVKLLFKTALLKFKEASPSKPLTKNSSAAEKLNRLPKKKTTITRKKTITNDTLTIKEN